MKKRQNQILCQFSSLDAKSFSENHLFSPQVLSKESSSLVNNSNSVKQINFQPISPSYLIQETLNTENKSIKNILNNIQRLIILNGFYKNLEDIKTIKFKISQLCKQNQVFQSKIKQLKTVSQVQNSMPSFHSSQIKKDQHDVKKNIFFEKKQIQLIKQIEIKQIKSYEQKIQSVKQKLAYQKSKQSIIQILKLSPEEKHQLLQKTKKQYQLLKRQVQSLSTVLASIQTGHPNEEWLKMEINLLESEFAEKSMFTKTDSRLQQNIEILKSKIFFLTMKKSNLEKTQLENRNKELANKNNLKLEIKTTKQKLDQCVGFLKNDQNQKSLLMSQLIEFDKIIDKQQQKNRQLLEKVKNSWCKCSEMLNWTLKTKENGQEDIQFILEEVGLNF